LFPQFRWEAKGIPNVRVAKIDESTYIKKEQSVYMPLIPEIPKCPEYLLPMKEWEDSLLLDFVHLRQVFFPDISSDLHGWLIAVSLLIDENESKCCYFYRL
jgi:survival of motor neuron protein-interacting protein 1